MVPRRVFAAERVCGGGVEADGEGLWAWREVEAVESIYIYNIYKREQEGAGGSREKAFSIFKILLFKNLCNAWRAQKIHLLSPKILNIHSRPFIFRTLVRNVYVNSKITYVELLDDIVYD